MEGVAGDHQHGRTVPQHFAAEALARGPWWDDVGGRPYRDPRDRGAHDWTQGEKPERQHVPASWDGGTCEHQRQGRDRRKFDGHVNRS